MTHRTTLCPVFAGLLSLLMQAPAEAHGGVSHRIEIRYEVIPVGPAVPGGYFEPVNLNNRGEMLVMGYQPAPVPFLWDCEHGRTQIPLPPDSNLNFAVTALNDAGQVIGHSEHITGGDWMRAFIWSREEGTRLLFDTPQGSATSAGDINAFGVVLGGEFIFAEGTGSAFLWSERIGRFDLPDQGFAYQRLTNRSELVALGGPGFDSLFLVRPHGGARLLLASPAGTHVNSADDINDRNDVVGSIYIDGIADARSYLALNNGELEVFSPEENSSLIPVLRSINNRRQVVGANLGYPEGVPHGEAFVWDPVNGMRDLTELVRSNNDSFPNLVFEMAHAINELGWIAARGVDHETGMNQPYLLVPVRAMARDRNFHLLTGRALCKALQRTRLNRWK